MTQKVERHERTGATKTTTPEKVTPRPGPTPAEIQARQKADAERSQRPAAPTNGGTSVVPVTPPPAPATSAAALERHLDSWAGPAGRLLAFNGAEGFHKTLDDGNEMEMPRRFVAHLEQTNKGYIRFNQDAPPTLAMRGIAEDAPEIERDDLGDTDTTAWPISGFTGQPDDPWKPQHTFPLVSSDSSAEVFIYVARGPVAENAVRSLLGKWKWHPKRRQGLLPVVEVTNGTYFSKRFKADRPKPDFRIVDWVSPDGAAPKALPSSEIFNDDIPY
jgi:hypothetical protein